MSGQLPVLSPQDEIDQSFIEGNDWLPETLGRRKHSKARVLLTDPLELQNRRPNELRPELQQHGEEPLEGVEKDISDNRQVLLIFVFDFVVYQKIDLLERCTNALSSETPPPEPVEVQDDVFDQSRLVR